MKGLNIKKVAAIGIGAALMGTALAPVVSAANMVEGGLDSLTRDQIVNEAGSPVVDVVVGSGAAVSDVVWAGNIAAKVAQLATTSVSLGGSGVVEDATVDVTVGGDVTTTGSGNTDENYVYSTAEFAPISADVTDVPTFESGTKSIKHPTLGSSYVDISIDENVQATVDASIQTLANKDMAGQVVAEVQSNGIYYTVDLGTGIPYYASAQTGLDENNDVDIKISFLGKEYVVDEIGEDGKSIVMYADTTPTDLSQGESITVAGAGDYEGKDLTLTFVSVFSTTTGSGSGSLVAKWNLFDGDTLISSKQGSGTYDLQESFGSDVIADSVHVTFIGKNESTSEGLTTIRTGNQRIELQNNKIFPYSSTASETNSLWRAGIITSGNKITALQLYNNKLRYLKSDLGNTDEEKGRMGPLATGDSVMIPGSQDYLKLEFLGLDSKKMSKVQVSADMTEETDKGLVITDTKGVEREVPYYINLTNGSNDVTIGGKTFTIDVNETAGAVKYWDRTIADVEAQANGRIVNWVEDDVNDGTAISFSVDNDWINSTSGKVDYYIAADETTHSYWLLLAAQTFDVDSSGDTTTTEVTFYGTDVDQNAVTDTYAAGRGIDFNFYLPDMSSLNVLTGAQFDDNQNGTADANLAGNTLPNEGNDYQFNASFSFNEQSSTPATSDVNIFVNTQTGELINTQDNKTRLNSTAEVVSGYGWNLNENTTSDASRLTAAGTVYGTELMVDSSVLTIMMPEEARKVKAYIGALDSVTTAVGGEALEGIAVGETDSTTGGTQITVDAVNGSCVAEGTAVTVVPVDNLVKTDASSNGKSIIVGGYAVNAAAEMLEIQNGDTLEDMLTSAGEYVAAVLASGDIVVAGYSASDTGAAASELINSLEALI